jgi:hypothetical protein
MTSEFVNVATLVGLGLIVILLFLFTTGRIGSRDRLANGLGHEVERLNSTVDTLLKRNDDLLVEIAKLRTELEKTQGELRVALERITLLDGKASLPGTTGRPAKPLLLVQCNKIFGDDDAQAIRRVGIPFHRLQECTSQKFDSYLQDFREDKASPWFVQISAHMGVDGVEFTDGVKGVQWLSQRIRDVRVLVLAGCENEEVGRQLVGLAQYVVVIYESISSRDAQSFSFSFWRAINEELGPREAFRRALIECPQTSEYIQMRGG